LHFTTIIAYFRGRYFRIDAISENVPLSEEELELIGTYFSRNYEEGERVHVPEDLPQHPYNWLEDQPVIRSSRFPLHEVRYSPDETPPRILLREEGDRLSRLLEEAKSSPTSIAAGSKFYDAMQLGGSMLSLGHHEFKVWLQSMVERVARGGASPKFLAGESPSLERSKALDKWDELTERVYELLKEKLIVHGNILEVEQLNLIDKIIERKEIEESWLYEESYENEEWYGDATWKICQVVVKSLISKSNTRPPKRGSKYDILRKDDFLEIALPGITFLEDASKKIASRINVLIEEARRLHGKIVPPQNYEYLSLTEKEERAFENLVSNGFGNRQGIKGAGDWPPDRLTLHNSKKLAYNILNLMIEKGILERRLMDWDDWIALFHSDKDEAKPRDRRKSYPHMLIFSPMLKDEWIGQSRYSDYQNNDLHPIYRWLSIERDRWMYCHPMLHSRSESGWEGGLLFDSETISNHSDYEERGTPRCAPSPESTLALNALEATQWEINLDLVEALFTVETDEGRTPLEEGIRGKSDRILKLRPKTDFEAAFFRPDDDSNPDDAARKNGERKTTIDWAKRIIEHNANVFWHSWAFDFRGRVYPRCRDLSPQGDDLDRALIRFKEWKPLGERGIFWLHVHVHNLFQGVQSDNWEAPQKRLPFEDRDSWVTANLKELRRIAKDPKESIAVLGLDKFSGGKSEAFQRLALVIELDRVWTEYDSKGSWNEVHSGQPVHLDATCSGYQHVAALLRNRNLARRVNIIPSTGIMDLYSDVSDLVGETMLAGYGQADRGASQLRNFLQENFSDEIRFKLMERLPCRELAKQPTILKVYGSHNFKKCFEGKRGTGNPDWQQHPKSEERLEEERAQREAIPDKIVQAFTKYESLEPPYYPGYWEWSWFVNLVKREGGTKAEAENYRDLIREWSWEAAWHSESPLYKAIMQEEKDPVTLRIDDDVILQGKMVKPIERAYLGAIDEVTDDAYDEINRSLQYLVDQTGKLHESIIRWSLPDGFEVRNYYIKHMDGGKSKKNSPTHSGSTYSKLRPSWYDPNRKFSILDRMEEVLGTKKTETLRDEMKILNDKTGVKMPRWDSTRVERELAEIDPKHENPGLDEVRRVLAWRDYSVTRYSDDENERIDPPKVKSSISPNFVHSLDAYHIRSVIRRMSEPDGRLDFWAVHDAFGTHPSRVDEMVRVVRETFHEMYLQRDINTWLEEMAPGQSTPVDTGDLDPDELMKSEYMIN